jgi:hypothetical protein
MTQVLSSDEIARQTYAKNRLAHQFSAYIFDLASKWVSIKDYRAAAYSACDRHMDAVRANIIDKKYERTFLSETEDIAVYSTDSECNYAMRKYIVCSHSRAMGTDDPNELQRLIDRLRDLNEQDNITRSTLSGLK